MKVGDLWQFRCGRNPITKDIRRVTGIILEIMDYKHPRMNRCKVLTLDGKVEYYTSHGSRGVTDETG